MAEKSKTHATSAEKELDKAQEQFQAFDQNVKDLTLDRMNAAPKLETEPQTKIAQVDRDKMRDIYLKPHRSINSKEKFNEDYRKDYEHDKEYVPFEAENKEIIGETIDMWTKPYAGMPAEWWQVPTNKPVWGPRYLAEQLKRCNYHRLTMQQTVSSGGDYAGQYYGAMAVNSTIQRLDARPVSTKKSFFMGKNNF